MVYKRLFRKGAGLKTPILSIRALRLEKNTYFVHYATNSGFIPLGSSSGAQCLSRLAAVWSPSIYPA